jgi:hypothetical protein
MFLTVAKNFTLGNKAYPPVTITNENGKGKPFFSIFHDFIFDSSFQWRKSFHICKLLMMRIGALQALSDTGQ